MDSALILAVLFFITALLYASVGQAGGSGYLAAMALVGIGPEVMRPTALVLNVLVATIATVLWVRAGQFTWSTFWPFTAGSVPLAFLGGVIRLPAGVFGPLVGLILLFGAVVLIRPLAAGSNQPSGPVPVVPALLAGALIGLLSGLTATGGAIFLVPLLVLTGWGDVRRAAGVSAAFILVNSVAGLAGALSEVHFLPGALPLWSVAASAGGLLGALLGTRIWSPAVLRRVLAIVLVPAAIRLLVGA